MVLYELFMLLLKPSNLLVSFLIFFKIDWFDYMYCFLPTDQSTFYRAGQERNSLTILRSAYLAISSKGVRVLLLYFCSMVQLLCTNYNYVYPPHVLNQKENCCNGKLQ